jgi:hypothetical protein
VFRHHPTHDADTLEERADRLMAEVFEPDDRLRLERLSADLAPDFRFITPTAVFDGPDGLSDAFAHFRHDAWRNAQLRRTSAVDGHHGYFRFTWERLDRGAVAESGLNVVQLDGQGRIWRVISFPGAGPEPAPE